MVFTAILAVVVIVPATHAQDVSALSLEDAVELFVASSAELDLARSRLKSRLGESDQSRAISNPTVSFTNEDLGPYSEQYLNLTQPVDFLWQRGPRDRNAEARARSARSEFEADSARIVLDLKQVFLAAWEGTLVVAAFAETDGVFDALVDDASARVAQGDLASYDLRRLSVAGATARHRLAQAELALADAERRLGSLVSRDRSIARVRALPPAVDVPDVTNALALLDEATARRPELDAARAMTEALEATESLVGRSRLEGVGLTGGFKQQSDGRDGLFLGLQMSLPLFDRRGGAIAAARADVDRSRSDSELLRVSIEREVALAAARLLAASQQRVVLDASGIGESEDLLAVARIAYDEGEVGIVELVDAADAFLEARLLASSIRTEEWRAFFELEHAIGGLPAGAGAQR
jgi:cobalt-zinc-cadmium efflux system outer membrane protein